MGAMCCYVKKFLVFDFDVGRIKNTRSESNTVMQRPYPMRKITLAWSPESAGKSQSMTKDDPA